MLCIVYLDGDVINCFFFFSSRRRHTRFDCDWSSDVCSSDLDGGDARELQVDALGMHRLLQREPLGERTHRPAGPRSGARASGSGGRQLQQQPQEVGSVSTEMNGRCACARRDSAAAVFAIWKSEYSASCMRAPPLAEKHTN